MAILIENVLKIAAVVLAGLSSVGGAGWAIINAVNAAELQRNSNTEGLEGTVSDLNSLYRMHGTQAEDITNLEKRDIEQAVRLQHLIDGQSKQLKATQDLIDAVNSLSD